MEKYLNVGELKRLLETVDDSCDVIVSAYDGQIDEFRHSYVTSIGILDGSKKFEDNDALSFMTGLSMGVSNTGICKKELYKDNRLN